MMMRLLHDLRETNSRLNLWLDGMFPKNGHPYLATPERMGALLSELLRAGEGLRSRPACGNGTDREQDEELEKYRRNVERLRDLLPAIRRELLAERSRLEFQRTRVKSAEEWIRASRQTL
jgi:hypothetical protein